MKLVVVTVTAVMDNCVVVMDVVMSVCHLILVL